MQYSEILKIPIDLFIEQDIAQDLLLPTNTVSDVFDKIVKVKDPSDFLVVYVKDDAVAAILLYRDVHKFLEQLEQGKSTFGELPSNKITLDKLALEDNFPPQYVLKSGDATGDIVSMLNEKGTDTVVVIDGSNRFIGKIRRRNFVEKLRMLLQE